MTSKDNPWLPKSTVGEILGVRIESADGFCPEKTTAESFARIVREMAATLAVDNFGLLEITIARKK